MVNGVGIVQQGLRLVGGLRAVTLVAHSNL